MWIKGRDRLPGLFTEVEWRNADGGNIPLGKRSPLEHYQKCGANINWHEWLDDSPPPPPASIQEAAKAAREDIVPDEEMIRAFGHSNFGATPKRDVILESLMKVVQGYHDGFTATSIVVDLGLVEKREKDKFRVLTDKGLQYLLAGASHLSVEVEKLKEQVQHHVKKEIEALKKYQFSTASQQGYKRNNDFLRARVTELQQVNERLKGVLGFDNPFPLHDVLFRLTEGVEKLLHKKDYDGPDYEELERCVVRAKETVNLLTQYLESINKQP